MVQSATVENYLKGIYHAQAALTSSTDLVAMGQIASCPHGDPIPDPEGTLVQPHDQSLLACPLRTPLIVTRVTDQDAAFLHFIEQHELKPGEIVEVEQRDAAADSVRLRGRDDRRVTIGARAASKLLVRLT